jgi:hypothetical protein
VKWVTIIYSLYNESDIDSSLLLHNIIVYNFFRVSSLEQQRQRKHFLQWPNFSSPKMYVKLNCVLQIKMAASSVVVAGYACVFALYCKLFAFPVRTLRGNCHPCQKLLTCWISCVDHTHEERRVDFHFFLRWGGKISSGVQAAPLSGASAGVRR